MPFKPQQEHAFVAETLAAVVLLWAATRALLWIVRAAAKLEQDATHAIPHKQTVGFCEEGWMTTKQYRSMLAEAGFPFNADQDVCHIIAKSKGGADHSDNYCRGSASANRWLGDRNDSYLADVVGLEQTKKAVAVSRTTGYKGPDAEDLIEMGKAARKAKGSYESSTFMQREHILHKMW